MIGFHDGLHDGFNDGISWLDVTNMVFLNDSDGFHDGNSRFHNRPHENLGHPTMDFFFVVFSLPGEPSVPSDPES